MSALHADSQAANRRLLGKGDVSNGRGQGRAGEEDGATTEGSDGSQGGHSGSGDKKIGRWVRWLMHTAFCI